MFARPSAGEKLTTRAAPLGAAVTLKGSYVFLLAVFCEDVILSLAADDGDETAGVTMATRNELKGLVTPSEGPFASTLAFKV